MTEFTEFRNAVDKQFRWMMEKTSNGLYKTAATKTDLWDSYLLAFPEGSNPIFIERTEHDCQCCKQFIRRAGGVVMIDQGLKVHSIWDVEVAEPYQTVANCMAMLVKTHPVDRIFLNDERKVGTDHSNREMANGDVITFDHFYTELGRGYVAGKTNIPTIMSESRNDFMVLSNGLAKLTKEALDTVLELIDAKAIYRGEEFQSQVSAFTKIKSQYDTLDEEDKHLFCWQQSRKCGPGLSRFKNTVIGTLVEDLSGDTPLEDAVKMYESKVAPTSYKRPTALVTPRMVDEAENTLRDLELIDALDRRYARASDVTVNNVIFMDRSAEGDQDVFDSLRGDTRVEAEKMKNTEEMYMNTFLTDVVPGATSIEVLLENRHDPNMVSLIAPVHPEAGGLFKWENNFSWAYNGGLTDSLKQRVKTAGGKIDGILRCSLGWYNTDDLDIHVRQPGGHTIYYSDSHDHSTSGRLDVDMNVNNLRRDAVENIVWTDRNKMETGTYELVVHQYTKRERVDVGFEAEIEYNGVIHKFAYAKSVTGKVRVATFEITKDGTFKILKSIPSTSSDKSMWKLTTNRFHTVQMLLNSPNHWDGEGTGNKHWFFMLEGCENDQRVRGFFNEFLKEEFTKHRKVFEILGEKMKTPPLYDEQLSGVGFSSTQTNSVICRVRNSGNSRTIKVNI